jgi:hypothetical protein
VKLYTKRIIVERTNPPIPTRAFDWSAWYDGEEEHGRVAHAPTREAAIRQILEPWDEDMDSGPVYNDYAIVLESQRRGDDPPIGADAPGRWGWAWEIWNLEHMRPEGVRRGWASEWRTACERGEAEAEKARAEAHGTVKTQGGRP